MTNFDGETQRRATDPLQPFPFATRTERYPEEDGREDAPICLCLSEPTPWDNTGAMAGSSERLETVVEEALEVDFEKIAGAEGAHRERCAGEQFPIFSDGEADDDNGEGAFPAEPRFVSRPTPLMEANRGAGADSGPIEQPQVREGWLSAKLREIAEAKSKLVRLDDAYNQKRRELNRLLEDFEHLAEVKRTLTDRVRDLTDQVTIARRLRHISAELCGDDEHGAGGKKVPKPPTTPPPDSLREAALRAGGRTVVARGMGGADDGDQPPAKRMGLGSGPLQENLERLKNVAEAPARLASGVRSPGRGVWVSIGAAAEETDVEGRKPLLAPPAPLDVWKGPSGVPPKSRAAGPPAKQVTKQRKRAIDEDECHDPAQNDE